MKKTTKKIVEKSKKNDESKKEDEETRKKTEKDERDEAEPSRTDNEVKDGQTKGQLRKHRVRRPEEQVALRARGMRLHPRRRGNLTAGGCEEEMVSS